MNHAATPPSPLEVLWQAPALTAVVLSGEGLALVLALAPGASGDRLVYFGLASLMIQWVSLLSLGALYALRRFLTHFPPQRVASLAVGLLLLNTWLIGTCAWAVLGSGPRGHVGLSDFLLQLTAIALTVGLLALAAFQNHWRARTLAVLAKHSELEALQARIRPHFLFNTLNTGAALIRDQPGQAERLLMDLADLFRAALAGPHDILLADELVLARRYLEIESLRFGERLRLVWDLPDLLPAVLMPALSIQPLVENAIRHGVEPSPRPTQVQVKVVVDDDAVWINVSNDLPPHGAIASPGHHLGLSSARQRIEALSRGRGRLDTAVRDGRFIATIRMPL